MLSTLQIVILAVLWSTHYICSLYTPGKNSQRSHVNSIAEGMSGKALLLVLTQFHKSRLMSLEFSFSNLEFC